jgi:hypothetical protein
MANFVAQNVAPEKSHRAIAVIGQIGHGHGTSLGLVSVLQFGWIT